MRRLIVQVRYIPTSCASEVKMSGMVIKGKDTSEQFIPFRGVMSDISEYCVRTKPEVGRTKLSTMLFEYQ